MEERKEVMSKGKGSSGKGGGRATPMTPKAAARVQAHADRSGTNAGFKGRAQAAAAKNSGGGKASGGGKGGGKGK